MSSPKSAAFYAAVENRRSYYGLSSKSPIADADIQTIVETAVKHVPSPYNTQTGRAVLFLGESNKTAWEIVRSEFLATLGNDEGAIKMHSEKIDGFESGYGSVYFFEDQSIIAAMYEKMPFFKKSKSFDVWSENSTGMLQYVVWTALEAEGFGASLQHHASYVTDINTALQKQFELPDSWKCTAMMPFGVPTGGPGHGNHPKTFEPLDKRVKVFTQ